MHPGAESVAITERALAFLRAVQDRCAGRIEPFRFGHVLLRDDLPLVWDLNLLRVEHDWDLADAPALIADAERLLRAAGLVHRRVAVDRASAGDRLAPGFAEAGWEVRRLLVMAHRHEPDRPPAALELAEVDVQRILPAREAAARTEPFGHHLEAVRQIVRLAGVVAESVPTRTFAGFAGGTVAAFCSLHEMAGVGQIEEVTTLSRFRDRGFARALVLHALAASRAAGNDLTIMVADEADWPKDLYRRLGFEPITLRYEFQRAGGRPRAAAPGS